MTIQNDKLRQQASKDDGEPIELSNEARDSNGNVFSAKVEFNRRQGQLEPTIVIEEKTNHTFGKWAWYLSTLKNNGYNDEILIDMGQRWTVTGMRAICEEAEKLLAIRNEEPTLPYEFDVDDETIASASGMRRKASLECLDCKSTVSKELYMLDDAVWSKANPSGDGLLCVGCVEKRLGRRLAKGDFQMIPLNFGKFFDRFRSPRLMDRLQRTAQFEDDEFDIDSLKEEVEQEHSDRSSTVPQPALRGDPRRGFAVQRRLSDGWNFVTQETFGSVRSALEYAAEHARAHPSINPQDMRVINLNEAEPDLTAIPLETFRVEYHTGQGWLPIIDDSTFATEHDAWERIRMLVHNSPAGIDEGHYRVVSTVRGPLGRQTTGFRVQYRTRRGGSGRWINGPTPSAIGGVYPTIEEAESAMRAHMMDAGRAENNDFRVVTIDGEPVSTDTPDRGVDPNRLALGRDYDITHQQIPGMAEGISRGRLIRKGPRALVFEDAETHNTYEYPVEALVSVEPGSPANRPRDGRIMFGVTTITQPMVNRNSELNGHAGEVLLIATTQDLWAAKNADDTWPFWWNSFDQGIQQAVDALRITWARPYPNIYIVPMADGLDEFRASEAWVEDDELSRILTAAARRPRSRGGRTRTAQFEDGDDFLVELEDELADDRVVSDAIRNRKPSIDALVIGTEYEWTEANDPETKTGRLDEVRLTDDVGIDETWLHLVNDRKQTGYSMQWSHVMTMRPVGQPKQSATKRKAQFEDDEDFMVDLQDEVSQEEADRESRRKTTERWLYKVTTIRTPLGRNDSGSDAILSVMPINGPDNVPEHEFADIAEALHDNGINFGVRGKWSMSVRASDAARLANDPRFRLADNDPVERFQVRGVQMMTMGLEGAQPLVGLPTYFETFQNARIALTGWLKRNPDEDPADYGVYSTRTNQKVDQPEEFTVERLQGDGTTWANAGLTPAYHTSAAMAVASLNDYLRATSGEQNIQNYRIISTHRGVVRDYAQIYPIRIQDGGGTVRGMWLFATRHPSPRERARMPFGDNSMVAVFESRGHWNRHRTVLSRGIGPWDATMNEVLRAIGAYNPIPGPNETPMEHLLSQDQLARVRRDDRFEESLDLFNGFYGRNMVATSSTRTAQADDEDFLVEIKNEVEREQAAQPQSSPPQQSQVVNVDDDTVEIDEAALFKMLEDNGLHLDDVIANRNNPNEVTIWFTSNELDGVASPKTLVRLEEGLQALPAVEYVLVNTSDYSARINFDREVYASTKGMRKKAQFDDEFDVGELKTEVEEETGSAVKRLTPTYRVKTRYFAPAYGGSEWIPPDDPRFEGEFDDLKGDFATFEEAGAAIKDFVNKHYEKRTQGGIILTDSSRFAIDKYVDGVLVPWLSAAEITSDKGVGRDRVQTPSGLWIERTAQFDEDDFDLDVADEKAMELEEASKQLPSGEPTEEGGSPSEPQEAESIAPTRWLFTVSSSQDGSRNVVTFMREKTWERERMGDKADKELNAALKEIGCIGSERTERGVGPYHRTQILNADQVSRLNSSPRFKSTREMYITETNMHTQGGPGHEVWSRHNHWYENLDDARRSLALTMAEMEQFGRRDDPPGSRHWRVVSGSGVDDSEEKFLIVQRSYSGQYDKMARKDWKTPMGRAAELSRIFDSKADASMSLSAFCNRNPEYRYNDFLIVSNLYGPIYPKTASTRTAQINDDFDFEELAADVGELPPPPVRDDRVFVRRMGLLLYREKALFDLFLRHGIEVDRTKTYSNRNDITATVKEDLLTTMDANDRVFKLDNACDEIKRSSPDVEDARVYNNGVGVTISMRRKAYPEEALEKALANKIASTKTAQFDDEVEIDYDEMIQSVQGLPQSAPPRSFTWGIAFRWKEVGAPDKTWTYFDDENGNMIRVKDVNSAAEMARELSIKAGEGKEVEARPLHRNEKRLGVWRNGVIVSASTKTAQIEGDDYDIIDDLQSEIEIDERDTTARAERTRAIMSNRALWLYSTQKVQVEPGEEPQDAYRVVFQRKNPRARDRIGNKVDDLLDNALKSLNCFFPPGQAKEGKQRNRVSIIPSTLMPAIQNDPRFISVHDYVKPAGSNGRLVKAQFEDDDDFLVELKDEVATEQEQKARESDEKAQTPAAGGASSNRGNFIVQHKVVTPGTANIWHNVVDSNDRDLLFPTREEAQGYVNGRIMGGGNSDDFRVVDRMQNSQLFSNQQNEPSSGTRWLYAARPITSAMAGAAPEYEDNVGNFIVTFTPREYWEENHSISDQEDAEMEDALGEMDASNGVQENEHILTDEQVQAIRRDPRFRESTEIWTHLEDRDYLRQVPVAAPLAGSRRTRVQTTYSIQARQVGSGPGWSTQYVVSSRRRANDLFRTVGAAVAGMPMDVRIIRNDGTVIRSGTFPNLPPTGRRSSSDEMTKKAQFEDDDFLVDIKDEVETEEAQKAKAREDAAAQALLAPPPARAVGQGRNRRWSLDRGQTYRVTYNTGLPPDEGKFTGYSPEGNPKFTSEGRGFSASMVAISSITPARWKVEHHFSYGWDDASWTETDDLGRTTPVTFATKEEAGDAIDEHIADAAEAGDMEDNEDLADYRAVPFFPEDATGGSEQSSQSRRFIIEQDVGGEWSREEFMDDSNDDYRPRTFASRDEAQRFIDHFMETASTEGGQVPSAADFRIVDAQEPSTAYRIEYRPVAPADAPWNPWRGYDNREDANAAFDGLVPTDNTQATSYRLVMTVDGQVTRVISQRAFPAVRGRSPTYTIEERYDNGDWLPLVAYNTVEQAEAGLENYLANNPRKRRHNFRITVSRGARASSLGVAKKAQFEDDDMSIDIKEEVFQEQEEADKAEAEKRARETFWVEGIRKYETGWEWNRMDHDEYMAANPFEDSYKTFDEAQKAINDRIARQGGHSSLAEHYRVVSSEDGVVSPQEFPYDLQLGESVPQRHPLWTSHSSHKTLEDAVAAMPEAKKKIIHKMNARIVDKRDGSKYDDEGVPLGPHSPIAQAKWPTKTAQFEDDEFDIDVLKEEVDRDQAEIATRPEPEPEPQEQVEHRQDGPFLSPYYPQILGDEGEWETSGGLESYDSADQAWGALSRAGGITDIEAGRCRVIDHNGVSMPRPPAWGEETALDLVPPFWPQYYNTSGWHNIRPDEPPRPIHDTPESAWLTAEVFRREHHLISQLVRVIDSAGHNAPTPQTLPSTFRIQWDNPSDTWEYVAFGVLSRIFPTRENAQATLDEHLSSHPDLDADSYRIVDETGNIATQQPTETFRVQWLTPTGRWEYPTRGHLARTFEDEGAAMQAIAEHVASNPGTASDGMRYRAVDSNGTPVVPTSGVPFRLTEESIDSMIRNRSYTWAYRENARVTRRSDTNGIFLGTTSRGPKMLQFRMPDGREEWILARQIRRIWLNRAGTASVLGLSKKAQFDDDNDDFILDIQREVEDEQKDLNPQKHQKPKGGQPNDPPPAVLTFSPSPDGSSVNVISSLLRDMIARHGFILERAPYIKPEDDQVARNRLPAGLPKEHGVELKLKDNSTNIPEDMTGFDRRTRAAMLKAAVEANPAVALARYVGNTLRVFCALPMLAAASKAGIPKTAQFDEDDFDINELKDEVSLDETRQQAEMESKKETFVVEKRHTPNGEWMPADALRRHFVSEEDARGAVATLIQQSQRGNPPRPEDYRIVSSTRGPLPNADRTMQGLAYVNGEPTLLGVPLRTTHDYVIGYNDVRRTSEDLPGIGRLTGIRDSEEGPVLTFNDVSDTGNDVDVRLEWISAIYLEGGTAGLTVSTGTAGTWFKGQRLNVGDHYSWTLSFGSPPANPRHGIFNSISPDGVGIIFLNTTDRSSPFVIAPASIERIERLPMGGIDFGSLEPGRTYEWTTTTPTDDPDHGMLIRVGRQSLTFEDADGSTFSVARTNISSISEVDGEGFDVNVENHPDARDVFRQFAAVPGRWDEAMRMVASGEDAAEVAHGVHQIARTWFEETRPRDDIQWDDVSTRVYELIEDTVRELPAPDMSARAYFEEFRSYFVGESALEQAHGRLYPDQGDSTDLDTEVDRVMEIAEEWYLENHDRAPDWSEIFDEFTELVTTALRYNRP